MDYEQKYKEALERAKGFIKSNQDNVETYVRIDKIFPELQESEDERIRKGLIDMFQRHPYCEINGLKTKDIVAWLEKQKENPKSVNSIPADCISNVKCENRWYKVQDFTPADGRLVLAKDNIGNYLLASFAGGEWFVERYDLDDVPMRHTYVTEWCEIPSEKQKEQKPDTEELVYRLNGLMQEYIKEGEDEEEREHRFKCYKLFWDALEDSSYFDEQKPSWSEEDEEIYKEVLQSFESVKFKKHHYATGKFTYAQVLSWLKSLKPQKQDNNISISPERLKELRDQSFEDGRKAGIAEMAKSMPMPEDTVLFQNGVKEGRRLEREEMWKPSEEQIKHLLILADYFESEGGISNAKDLRKLGEDLKKLKEE